MSKISTQPPLSKMATLTHRSSKLSGEPHIAHAKTQVNKRESSGRLINVNTMKAPVPN